MGFIRVKYITTKLGVIIARRTGPGHSKDHEPEGSFSYARRKNSGRDFSGWPGSCLRGVGQAKKSAAQDIVDRHDIRKKDQAPAADPCSACKVGKSLMNAEGPDGNRPALPFCLQPGSGSLRDHR